MKHYHSKPRTENFKLFYPHPHLQKDRGEYMYDAMNFMICRVQWEKKMEWEMNPKWEEEDDTQISFPIGLGQS